jgi:regulator of sigma E protease
MTAVSFVFAFVVMLGLLIFVHELGHFLVAKACGVRVLKFSLGFGSPIGFGRWRLAWERGGTEYVVAWFPLGGFVKMLGENPDEEESPEALSDPAHALNAKPVWQKLAIVFAGPGMNLLLPVIVFAGSLAVGMPRPAPVVGMVESNSPAVAAGLRAGDRISSVEGEPIRWWDELDERVRASAGELLDLRVTRGEHEIELQLPVLERSGIDEFGGVESVGWAGLRHERLLPVVGIPETDAPAARAGLRSGDLIREVSGVPVEDWSQLEKAYATAENPARLRVERGSPGSVQTLEIEVPAPGTLAKLGVIPATALISQVSPGSPAERAGLRPGDLILTADGAPVGSFASFAQTVRTSGGRPIELTHARAGEIHEVTIRPELQATDTGLGVDEERYLIGITAESASTVGAVATDRERNPLVAIPRAVGMTVAVTGTYLRGLGKIVTGEVSRKQIAGPIGIAVIAHNALQRGWEAYLSMLVMISINLGILNLLPIPVLDGGQALLFAVEGVKRRPVSIRTKEMFQQFGVVLLILIMGLAFWNDISRYWSKALDYLRNTTGL